MRINSAQKQFRDLKSDLLVLILNEKEVKSGKSSNNRLNKYLSEIAQSFNLKSSLSLFKKNLLEGKWGQKLFLATPQLSQCKGVYFVVWEEVKDELERAERLREIGGWIAALAKNKNFKNLALIGGEFDPAGTDVLEGIVEGVGLASYSFDKYKSSKDKFRLQGIQVISSRKVRTELVSELKSVLEAVAFCRNLVNTVPKECTPRYIVNQCRQIAREEKLSFRVWDKERLRKIKAGLLLAVSAGSSEPPYLVSMSYKPRGAKKVLALVGKGVTFDSGGYNLKPTGSMETMKCDMSGAAAVISLMKIVRKLSPKVEVRAYVPLTENLVNGSAVKPGDVIKGIGGKSVEILNTDAEGRLILADAIALACKEGCDYMIDLATLTGSCVVALGTQCAGLFSNDERLSSQIKSAALSSAEKVWAMPLFSRYRKQLESKIADLKNIGTRWGGSITAALFLKEFVKDSVKWAHLDIAGPAFYESAANSYLAAGATGFGVRTLAKVVKKLS
ncbi:MAG: leucyl aminopeptidase [Candidatus Dadabacteria bacterium]|nr:MAG: leucyl aminopeptidase [Candidatus Dadabacteria bacterium]